MGGVIEAVGGAVFGFVAGLCAYWMLRSVDVYQVEVLISLALVAGGYALADAVKMKNRNINFVFVPSNKVGLQMVADGRIFGFMDTISTIGYTIQREYFGELKIGGKFGIEWELGVAARNDEPLLGEIFERAVVAVPDQTKQKI